MFYYKGNYNDKDLKNISDHLVMLFNHSSCTIEEIRLILDLSHEDFDDLVNKCYRDSRLDTDFRSYDFRRPKYYYSRSRSGGDGFYIRKTIDGRKVNFGTYKSVSEARFVVNELIKCGWDKSKLDSIRKKIK